MKLLTHIAETNSWSKRVQKSGLSIGFVPTMGALHAGHLSLVKRAKDENQRVAVSIFVNPIQFNNPTDLQKYPRDLEKDLDLLSELLGEDDIVFAPHESEIYPAEVTKKYNFGSLESVMEGAHRPGHFNGVGVVVDLLFRIVEPQRAYFGEKDFQQLAIIQELVRIEKHPVTIIPCAIAREPDGLAMSSRNVRLTEICRKNAPEIYRAMKVARDQLKQAGSLKQLQMEIESHLNRFPDFQVEYVCFALENTLALIEKPVKEPFRCFIAVFAGEVRLIDNLPMN